MKEIYKQIGIYRITNIENRKSYIGKTGMNFGDRWDSHRALLRAGRHDNPHLQRAWNHYGEDSFEFAVVEVVDDPEFLNGLEIKYIAEYKNAGLSYNIHDGGDGGYNLGKHLSEETKRKIGEKNSVNMTGRTVTEETKQKMSRAQKKRYENWTDEDRAAHGRLTARYARGYTWSEESKAAFSKKQQSKPNSAKYTPDDIRTIRSRKERGDTLKSIAEDYGTTPSYISTIVHRRRWANI